MESLYPLIIIAPLLGFLINGLFGKKFPDWGVFTVGVGSISISFLLAFHEFASGFGSKGLKLFTWIKAGSFQADISLLFDPLSSIMIVMVTGVGLLIHIYSCGYMSHDPGKARFFSYMNLFIFAMLTLVLADNFLMMFIGWEGVGLCSYLLIGFWYEKSSAADAGMKAFIVNRIGDLGFLLGMFTLFSIFGTLNFLELRSLSASLPVEASGGIITAATLLLFIGATGKSAQLPLHIWLPDAMEGPTPVSALIHAATMVTAGVYMVARTNFLYILSPKTMVIVAVVGALTALFAATIGMTQFDIKRVLAYSTISQLGYMFLAVGIGAFTAGIFHLLTHAFFKALLFLGAGSVMHATGDELDMRRMGALKKYMKITQPTMFIASLAISGIPPFAGFFSKDAILADVFAHSGFLPKLLWSIGIITAGLTAFYMFRLLFMTFWGENRGIAGRRAHIHESPRQMTIPLTIFAGGVILIGFIGVPGFLGGGNWLGGYLAPVISNAKETGGAGSLSVLSEWMLALLSVGVAAGGIYLARQFYQSGDFDKPKRISDKLGRLYRFVYNKYKVDELYNAAVIRPMIWFSDNVLRDWVDEGFIDGAMVNGSAGFFKRFSGAISRLQSGYLQTYIVIFLIGILILIWLLF
jgi:NADH-quinone oxidoreductase subunit L